MSDHLTQEQLASYHRRTLSPAELLAADGHLAECSACRERLGEIDPRQGTLMLLQENLQEAAGAEPAHLPYELLEQWVDRTIDERDRERVEGHVARCTQCAADLEDLRRFAAGMAAESGQGPPARARWRRFLAFWTLPAQWTSLSLARAAASVALVVTVSVAGWLVWRSGRTGGVQDARRAQSSPPASLPGSAGLPNPGSSGITAPVSPEAAPTPRPVPESVLSLKIGGGRQITLDKQGQVSGIEDYPASLRKMIQTTVTARRVATAPVLTHLIGRVRYRGDADPAPPFHLLSPAGTVIQTDTPTFRWQPWGEASGYTVQVFNTRDEEVGRSPRLSGSEWVSARSLPRGESYTWQVTASQDGQEHTVATASGRPAKFRVLERAKAEELARARTRYPDSPLVLGLLYAQEGILDDAQLQLEALAEANRDASPAARELVEKLSADLQALRATPSR